MRVIIRGISVNVDKKSSNIDNILETVSSALKDSGMRIEAEQYKSASVILGTTFSNFHIRKENTEKYFKQGLRVINPADFPNGLISYLGGCVSTKLNIQGTHSTLSSGISSGIDALNYALYLVARNNKGKAIVIELGESIKAGKQFGLEGIASCILESSTLTNGQGEYGDILGIASFFEKRGSSRGLSLALEKCLNCYTRDPKSISCIISSAARGTQRNMLEKKAVARIHSLSRIVVVSLPDKGKNNNFGLFPICSALRSNDFCKFVNKKAADQPSVVALFINVGNDTNSSCVALEMPLKRE